MRTPGIEKLEGPYSEAVTGNMGSCSRGIAACWDCSVEGTQLPFRECRTRAKTRIEVQRTEIEGRGTKNFARGSFA